MRCVGDAAVRPLLRPDAVGVSTRGRMSVDEAKSKCDGDVIALEYAPGQCRRIRVSDGTLFAIGYGGALFGLAVTAIVFGLLRPAQCTASKTTSAQADLFNGGTVSKAIVAYQFNVGAYPLRLIDLCERPEDPVAASKWAGPYFQDAEALIDRWGTPYRYAVSPPGAVGRPFRLASAGPDRVFGTADDIRNW